ncbi:MAG: LuxR family transcriptional regulator [Pseudomonadota bacterium]|nr:LuxR family transcriptional regulator [Pseudomonadota bacterium]
MHEDHPASRRTHGAAILFALIAVLIAGDLLTDRGEGAGLAHLAVEFLVLVAATAGAAALWRRVGQARLDLASARAEAERWRAENRTLVRGLGEAILQQFDRWQLTAAECEIGLFLLKGLSLKEIAALRATSERTVREQARALYRKAGLEGRHALSAFFLEDLLPAAEAETAV